MRWCTAMMLVGWVLAVATPESSAQIFGSKKPKTPPKQRVQELIVNLKEDNDAHKRADAAEELRQGVVVRNSGLRFLVRGGHAACGGNADDGCLVLGHDGAVVGGRHERHQVGRGAGLRLSRCDTLGGGLLRVQKGLCG